MKNINITSTWSGKLGDRTIVGASLTEQAPGNHDALIHTISLDVGYEL